MREFPNYLWRKSRYSIGQGNCVEVAMTQSAVGIRDTKNREDGVLVVGADQWHAFIRGLRQGLFDLS